jgi:hypothetical protein
MYIPRYEPVLDREADRHKVVAVLRVTYVRRANFSLVGPPTV